MSFSKEQCLEWSFILFFICFLCSCEVPVILNSDRTIHKSIIDNVLLPLHQVAQVLYKHYVTIDITSYEAEISECFQMSQLSSLVTWLYGYQFMLTSLHDCHYYVLWSTYFAPCILIQDCFLINASQVNDNKKLNIIHICFCQITVIRILKLTENTDSWTKAYIIFIWSIVWYIWKCESH